MSNITYILKRDFRRIMTNWVALLVVIGVCILPSFYAWFNIGANYDPYNNTSQIKIAVSSDDKGTTIDKKNLNAGNEIIKALKKNHKLGWTFVSTDKAKAGVRSGDYYAAIIIPESFSSDLTSFLKGRLDNPEIDYYVNEKKNAIAPKITDTGATTVERAVDAVFKGAVTGVIAKTMKTTAGDLKTGIKGGSNDLIDTIDNTQATIGKYQDSISQFHSSYGSYTRTIRNTVALNSSLDKNLTALRKTIGTGDSIVSKAEQDTAYLSSEVKEFKKAHPEILVEFTDELLTRLNKMEAKLSSTDRILNSTSGLLTTVQPATAITSDMLGNLKSSLKNADNALTSMSSALTSTDQLLTDAKAGLTSLQSASSFETLTSLSQLKTNKLAKFMAAPIELKQEKLYPVKTYGSGMAPFYTLLAIWVSGFILIAIFHLEVDTEEEKERRITMTQTYFSRGILFTIMGIIQALIICIGDIWLLGIQCLHPAYFVFAGVIASIVFVNLIYALAITFRHVGKALAVILVILQIPGSSGTYPIELTGEFFQSINPFLPFTYGIASLREAIGGFYENTYWTNLFVLLIFLLVAFFIGVVLRPLLMNINHTFDTRLEDTGLFEGDKGPEAVKIESVKKVLRILNSDKEAHDDLERKAIAFENRYQWLLSKGIIIALIPPIVLLLLLFILPSKPALLVVWIISVIAVCLFLFIIEHLHVTISENTYGSNLNIPGRHMNNPDDPKSQLNDAKEVSYDE